MLKHNYNLIKNSLVLQFLIIFSLRILLIQIFKYLPVDGPEKSFNFQTVPTVTGVSVLFVLAAFEEFISRFFIKIKSWVSIVWLFLYTYFFIISPFFFVFKINLSVIDISVITISCVSAVILNKFSNYKFNSIISSTSTKIVISVVGFALIHLSNYDVEPAQLIYMIPIILLNHCPFAYFLATIHLNYKHGFWIATGFHFLNNVLVMILNFIVM